MYKYIYLYILSKLNILNIQIFFEITELILLNKTSPPPPEISGSANGLGGFDHTCHFFRDVTHPTQLKQIHL